MPNTFQEDYAVGKHNEVVVLPLLREFFADPSIRNTMDMFSTADFEGERRYEMKSRDLYSMDALCGDGEGLIIDVGKTITNDVIIWNLLDKIVFLDSDDILGGGFEIATQKNGFRKDEPSSAKMNAKVFKVPISRTKLLHQYETPRQKKPSKCLIVLDDADY